MRAVASKIVIRPIPTQHSLIKNLDQYATYADCRYGRVVSTCKLNPLKLQPGDILVFNTGFQHNVYFSGQFFIGMELGLNDTNTYWVVSASANSGFGPFGYFRGLKADWGEQMDSISEKDFITHFTPFPNIIICKPVKDEARTEAQRGILQRKVESQPQIIGTAGEKLSQNSAFDMIKSLVVYKREKATVYISSLDHIKKDDTLCVHGMSVGIEKIAGRPVVVLNYHEDVFAKD